MVEPNACTDAADSQQTTQTNHRTQPEMLNVGFWQREENRRTPRKTLVAQERINGQLYSHMARPGIEPRTIVVRGEHTTHKPPNAN